MNAPTLLKREERNAEPKDRQCDQDEYPTTTHTQFCLLGTKELLTPIPDMLGVKTSPKPYRKIHKIVFYAGDKLEKTYQFMYYNDDVVCLGRKKDEFSKVVAYGKRSAENRKKKKLEKLALGQKVAVPVETVGEANGT